MLEAHSSLEANHHRLRLQVDIPDFLHAMLNLFLQRENLGATVATFAGLTLTTATSGYTLAWIPTAPFPPNKIGNIIQYFIYINYY